MALHKSWVFFFQPTSVNHLTFLQQCLLQPLTMNPNLGLAFRTQQCCLIQRHGASCRLGTDLVEIKHISQSFFFGSGADLIATHIFVASQPLVSEKKKTQLFRFLQKVLSQIALFSSYAVQHVSLSDARVADWFLFFFKEHTRLFNRKPHLFFVYTHTVCGCTWVCLYMCIYILISGGLGSSVCVRFLRFLASIEAQCYLPLSIRPGKP